MNLPPDFEPNGPDKAGVISWVHLGDLHMVRSGEQNFRDLQAIVSQLNAAFHQGVSFVYLPGDNADNGSAAAYATVRQALDRLELPWCAIVGDHDVHEKSHANFLGFLSRNPHYAFSVGAVRFLALNAFDIPEPPSFAMLPPQLAWLEQQLAQAQAASERTVLLLHCYPGDLKEGRERLQALVRQYRPLLIDMGHTHYNEIANDGHTLYTATRSTGQIEEGPVGFSVACIDVDLVSWRFFPLGQDPCVLITHPGDGRLATAPSSTEPVEIRAKIWSGYELATVTARIDHGSQTPMERIPGSNVWHCGFEPGASAARTAIVTVIATTQSNLQGSDSIRLTREEEATTSVGAHEASYALPAWPEHGILGTQLGPNKNGRKW